MNLPPRLQMPAYPSRNPYSQSSQPAFMDPGAQLYSSPVALGPAAAAGGFAYGPAAGGPPPAQFPAFYGTPQPYYPHHPGAMIGPPRGPYQPPPTGASGVLGASVSSPPAYSNAYIRAPPSLPSPSTSPINSTTHNSIFTSPNQPAQPSGSVSSGMSSSPPGPFRSKLGHATTPSFHPGMAVRRPVLTLRPPVLPSISRGGSPALSATGSPRDREEKKRKILVKLPWETWEEGDEPDVVDETKGARKRSTMSRRPLDDDAKRQRLEEMDISGVEAAETTTRARHFDEDRLAELPPSIEIYLPGQECWDDMRQALLDEKLAQLGYSPSGPDPLSARLNSYIEHQNAWPSSSQPSPTTSAPASAHLRTGSLFLPLLPPRLQQAYDTVTGFGRAAAPSKGHGSSFSMGGPLAKSFTMPSSLWSPPPAPESVKLPSGPAALSPRPGRDSGELGSPLSNTSCKEAAKSTTLSKERGRRLTLAELSRGFGIDEEVEGEGEPAPAAKLDDDRESRRSHQLSGQSTRTGDASGSDALVDFDDDGEDAIATNPSDGEQRLAAPMPALGHVHRASLGTEGLGLLPGKLVPLEQSLLVQQGQYGGGSDSGDEPGDDGELSEGEFSNPSDEERTRAQRRAHWGVDTKPEGSMGAVPVALDAEKNVLFQAPADVDLSAVDESPLDRDRRADVHFTPRSPLPAPPALGPSRSSNSLRATLSTEQLAHSDATASRLNVDAPEFVFGVPTSRIAALTPTFGRSASTTSLGSAGFAPSIGAPGSLAGLDSCPPSPAKATAVLPHLNPFAGEFQPTFKFKLPAEAPALPAPEQPATPSHSATSSSVRNTPTVRGPLPPVPLVHTVPSHIVKRLKVESPPSDGDADEPVQLLPSHASPGKDNVRGFKFPHGAIESPPAQNNGSSSLHTTPTANSHSTPPAPAHHSSDTPTTARPFTLKATSAAVSPDGRVVGFSPTARRPPIPDFGSNDDESGRDARRESMDDINLPSISRPRSRAMPVPHLPKKVLDYGVPKWITDDDEEDDSLFGSDAMPLTPNSPSREFERSERASNEADDEDEQSNLEDDSPLRILELIIDRQFDSLREELSGFTSLKADLDSLKHDALIDSLVGRMESIMEHSRNADSDARIANLSNVREAVDSGSRQLQDVLLAAVRELKSAAIPDQSGLDETKLFDFIGSQRDQVVSAVAETVKLQLAESAAPTIDLVQVTAVVEDAIAPLRELFAINSTSNDSNTAAPAAFEKLDAAVAAFENATSKLATAPADTRLSAELETAITMLQKAALEQSAFPQRVAASVQPLVAGIFERLADRSDAGDKVVERIIPTLELIAERPVQSADELSAVLCAQLSPLLSPLADLALLPAQVARAVAAAAPPLPLPVDIETLADRIITELREEQPLASLATTNHVAKLVDGQEQLDGRTADILSGQASLTNLVSSLRADVSSRFEQTHARLEEHAGLVSANNALTTQISELESQLAKARNEYGKARSEKAALSERVDAERASLGSEVARLKEKVQSHEEVERLSMVEQGLLKQTIERLEDEVRQGQAKVASLEGKLADAKAHQEAWHDTELKHITTLAENQAGRRALESEAQVSSDEMTRLRAELAELRTAHEGLSQKNETLSSDLLTERESAARKKGEVAALEKRISSQDDKIGNLQRLNQSKQQALALANQRASDLDKRTAELADARTQLSQATANVVSLETQLVEKDATTALVRQETDAFREALEADLEKMKVAVAADIQHKNEELAASQSENGRLQAHNAELSRGLDLATERSHGNGYLPPPPNLISRPQTAQPSFSAYSNFSTSYAEEYSGVGSSMWAPTPKAYGFPPSADFFVEQQHTGSTIHRPSSTASRATNRSAREIPKAADGWWG